ncbi:MAG: HAMP domain-containing histidine kinase [Armatimonadetes bacterium]|nr:HAMP domain-containing histidine kinase [Akkermansiaceae bacterium]
MFDSLRLLFDTSDFPARWNCGHWAPVHGWFHILSDLAIAGAYAMIPLAIARYCWVKRSELAFPKVLWLFAAFIFSCGSTHLIEAIIFYHPVYRVSAVLKVITAVVSWATVIAIVRIAPKALELPGQLRMNQQLQEQLAISKQAHEAAERSNRDLAAFTGIVTHDLKNPMSGALFMADLAKEACESGDLKLAREEMDAVLRSLRQMNRFVEELHELALSREDTTSLSHVWLDEVLATMMEKLTPTLEEAGARVTIGKLPAVKGNPTLLLQLFSNLIENAVKYRSEDAPVITIQADSNDQQEIVRVIDNGRGIPAADRERIFEPEARAGNAGDVPGSGLGLSLCRRIMEQHGGAIRVSEANRGTVFELGFPKTPSDDGFNAA